MLPLDLHVLSLSLAFILSQDQTLRCSNCFMSLLKIPLLFQVQVFFDGIHSKYLYYCCICKFLKELLSIVSCETWCKGKDFYFYLPNFFESFFDLFFWKFLSERLQDIRLDLPTSSLGISISGFLNPSFIMSPPHLSRLRVQKYCCKTYFPNVFPSFLQLFFTLLDCQWFTNKLLSVLLLSSLSILFLLHKFSILHSQFSKSRRVFIISRRLFSKRRRLFLLLCLSF